MDRVLGHFGQFSATHVSNRPHFYTRFKVCPQICVLHCWFSTKLRNSLAVRPCYFVWLFYSHLYFTISVALHKKGELLLLVCIFLLTTRLISRTIWPFNVILFYYYHLVVFLFWCYLRFASVSFWMQIKSLRYVQRQNLTAD